jgi:tRNA(Ile)-lysidine synthase
MKNSSISLEEIIANHINKAKGARILLAVSGGVDSMVLLHLFSKLNVPFEVAHCNFLLRGEESNKDFLFVKTVCLNHHLVFHGKKFETTTYAKENNLSIQMAARELRYNWFKEIIATNNLNTLATAHNSNDQVETVLLNIFRGKGNFTWEGMDIQSTSIFRPLLTVSKKEIIAYARENKIEWREDSSNEKSDYQRNYLRNISIPELSKNFPSLENNLLQFSEINRYNNSILRNYFRDKKSQICVTENSQLKINISQLIREEQPSILLFHFLQSYGFNMENCQQIISSYKSVGKKIFSKNFIALIDRDFILIKKSETANNPALLFNHTEKEIVFNNYRFSFSVIANKQIELKTNMKSVAFIDYSMIDDSLELRTYREGDYFYPLGMKGKKMLSDFFIDEKINGFQKKETPILCSKGQIIWIAGHRLDDRYKVKETTTSILRVDVSLISN